MPLDNSFDDFWPEHQSFYYARAQWRLSRPLLPRKCNLSGRWLWIKPAMQGTRIITGPGDPILERYWVDANEFMLHKLKYGY